MRVRTPAYLEKGGGILLVSVLVERGREEEVLGIGEG